MWYLKLITWEVVIITFMWYTYEVGAGVNVVFVCCLLHVVYRWYYKLITWKVVIIVGSGDHVVFMWCLCGVYYLWGGQSVHLFLSLLINNWSDQWVEYHPLDAPV